MKRWLIVLVGVAAALVIIVGTAVATTLINNRTSRSEEAGQPSSYSSTPGQAPRGSARMPGWGWMHGGTLQNEADYLTTMVAHHQEAVAAATQLQRSDRPQMRAFGAAIVKTQSAQIEQMNRWLRQWYPHRSPDRHYEPMMRDLTHLSGNQLDRTFLQDMIGHHMAAVMMSQQLLVRGLAEHPEVNRLAVTIRNDQHAEIFQMMRWLRTWYHQTWPGRWRGGHMYRGWDDTTPGGPGGQMGPGMMGQ